MMWEKLPSAAQMAAVLDDAPAAILVRARDTREVLYCNRAAEALEGWDTPCPPCPEGGAYTREFSPPGGTRTYRVSGKPADWGGRPAQIEFIVDITAPRQGGARLDALQETLEQTFNSIPCGLCVYRADGGRITPLFHNPAFFELLGCSEGRADKIRREMSFWGVHPDDLGHLKEAVEGLVMGGGVLRITFRMFNEKRGEYRHIRLEGSSSLQGDGARLLYAVYTDISERMRLEKELADANEKMEDIINAIPGGVAIYKVSDIFETVYFSDGVPELSGYTVEEYHELAKGDAAVMTYPADTAMVVGRIREAIERHEVADFEFRKLHRDGHIVWVHVQARQIGEEDGCPLLHCVFHNITALKETQSELDHLVNSIPGGIASYRVEGKRFIPTYFSDGVPALSGHTREEFVGLVRDDALDIIYEQDRPRVLAAAQSSVIGGGVLDVSYRMRHKDGRLIWIHLNGRRMGPLAESTRFYAVFTGMSAEARLFQGIANETADGIYVIDRESYSLLYANEARRLFLGGAECSGQKCYAALHGMPSPCASCPIGTYGADGEEHEMQVDGRYYSTRVRETDWNGIPAYIKYVRDITDEVGMRREKERLDRYFQTMVKNLPGGVAVVCCRKTGEMAPEFLSDGFAAMTGMAPEEAWALYRGDAGAGIHPDDAAMVKGRIRDYIAAGKGRCEMVYRLRHGADGYIWVKVNFSIIQDEGEECRVYAVYHDVTEERAQQERLRAQYKELLMQHYRSADPDALIVGHYNVTQGQVLEIIDHTGSALLEAFGTVAEGFFTGLAGCILERDERGAFLEAFLSPPGGTWENGAETVQKCFIRLPGQARGCYAQFKVNLVETPDSGDLIGILTVTDVTEQTITDRILHQLSVTNYDFIIDLDLERDTYTILASNAAAQNLPAQHGRHSARLQGMGRSLVVPRDRERYQQALEPGRMRRRLLEEGPYTFAFSIEAEKGDIRTKNITVSPVDLRLGRVCLVRTDITDSVREQQGMLHIMAYTFEMIGFIDICSDRLTMYTRQTVLENLAPYVADGYSSLLGQFTRSYVPDGGLDAREQFRLEAMCARLAAQPTGYDFVMPYRGEDSAQGLRYKQVNVLWGDVNRRTVCLVRADVTDMLAAERRAKRELEKALSLAEEASRAKSDFLSAMSHDIRTPMNAIMGMTALASAHPDDPARVSDCLQKISVASRHLLSLINDILDMSKIERAKITLGRVRILLPDLLGQLSAIMEPQARAAGLRFEIQARDVRHACFYGDALRINQILINILNNAIKFTPEGGRVDFQVEELPAVAGDGYVRYRFTVRDTGVGMPEGFISHIFDPFTRSRNTTRVEGTGLGLSITKGLVDLMGGSITVRSKLGEGSAFAVELECEEAQPGDAHPPERDAGGDGAARQPFAGRRFLVAEDNAINAEILSELLLMYGASCDVRGDGAQAVRTFLEAAPGTYDAVLMDIQMPVMNGYEATRAIRESGHADAARIPVIAMTANAFAEDIQASADAGMDAHVAKPIDMDVLQETLYHTLGNAEG